MNKLTIEIKRIRKVQIPKKSYSTDLGIDVYLPELDLSYINEYSKINGFYNKSTGIAIRDAYIKYKELYIPKYGNVIIPSGLIVKIPKGYGLIAYNRSSVASKLGLILGACVIDYNYLKEIYINLINTSRNEVFIKENTKICQLVVVPVVDVDIVEKDFDTSNSRGGFGSTDNTT